MGTGPSFPLAADFDNDGDIDLAVANFDNDGSPGNSISILINWTNDTADADFDGIVVQTAVTGASELGFGREFPRLMRRISDNADGTTSVDSLVGTNQGTFILHVTFQTSDMATTKAKLRRVTHEAVARLDEKSASSPAAPVLPRINPTKTSSWSRLKELAADREARYDLRTLFDTDEERSEKLSITLSDDFEVDFSMNLIDDETMAVLLRLA